MAYFHHHVPLSQAIKTKTRLALSIALNRNVMWIIILFFFTRSSKTLAMVAMAALFNWVEMCWRATGDTGTVVQLGQCQTLKPWHSLFLSENTFFHTLTPFLSSSMLRISVSPSSMCPLSLLPQSSQYPRSIQLHCAFW